MKQEKIAIGKIIKAHGIQGECLFFSYSGEFEIKKYSQYFHYSQVGEWEILTIKKAKSYQKAKCFLMQIEGITREILEKKYLQTEIYVNELNYETLQEGEYFYQDLMDNSVFINGQFCGKTIGVNNFGSIDVVEVLLNEKNKHQKEHIVFFPLQEGFFIEHNVKKKELYFQNVDHLL